MSITAYLCVKDGEAALSFYAKAFGAEEIMRMKDDSGRISHAEMKIGDAVIFLSDEHREIEVLSPQSLGGTPVTLVLDVPDVDASAALAVEAGMIVVRPVADQGPGLRLGKFLDPFGHSWMICRH